MEKILLRAFSILFFLLLAAPAAALPSGAATSSSWAMTVDFGGGAGTASSTTFKLGAILGNAIAGSANSTSWALMMGGMLVYPDNRANGAFCIAGIQCASGSCCNNVCWPGSCPTVASATVVSGLPRPANLTNVTNVTINMTVGNCVAEKLPVKVKYKLSVNKKEQVKCQIEERGRIIRGMRITQANRNVKDALISTSEASRSEEAPEPPGEVFKYIEISPEGLNEADVSEVEITFEVSRAWLLSNNISHKTVALQRFAGGMWAKLPTIEIGETPSDIFYSALSPGFSLFAIAGEPVKEEKQECPICPADSEWSACEAGNQARVGWSCGAETNYTCSGKTEHASCAACPQCPEPSAWSDCLDTKQTRTAHACSQDTNFTCVKKIESKVCGCPKEQDVVLVAAQNAIDLARLSGCDVTIATTLLSQALAAPDCEFAAVLALQARTAAERAAAKAAQPSAAAAPPEQYIVFIIIAAAVVLVFLFRQKILHFRAPAGASPDNSKKPKRIG